MRLDSVRNLKQELLGGVVSMSVADSLQPRSRAAARAISPRGVVLADANALSIGARAISDLPQIKRSIALGVSPKGKQFRLAVRVQHQALLSSPLVDEIRRRAKGEVDVRHIGRIDKRARQWYQGRTRPVLIGASIAHFKVTAGTIGAFVKRGAAVCILSNNHVLANENGAKAGDRILQPGPYDGGAASDLVARLGAFVRLRAGQANLVDAAIAEISAGLKFEPTLLKGLVKGKDRHLAGLGPEFLDEGIKVYKVGRTTGATEGRVTAFDMDNVVVHYDLGNIRFNNQVEIEGVGRRAFSDGGDSGSLIVSPDMKAVALLFAGGEVGGSNGLGLTYANPIHKVLEALRATLLV